MERTTSIKLKAAFLLLVFALNTVVGFACSMGVNMGFNSHHHDEAPVHIHADGKRHQHHQHEHPHGKDNCCNDAVVKFQQVDKNRAPGTQAAPDAIAILFSSSFSINNVTIAAPAYARRIIRNYYPPPPDIRIFIQSFLI